MTDEDSDGSDCGTNYDSGKGGSYLDVYKLSKSIHPINRMRKNKLQLVNFSNHSSLLQQYDFL